MRTLEAIIKAMIAEINYNILLVYFQPKILKTSLKSRELRLQMLIQEVYRRAKKLKLCSCWL